MQALVIDHGIRLDNDHPLPKRQAGEVLIQTTLAGICATDLALLQGYAHFQGVPGHEFVGVVQQADDPSLIGQRVVGEINAPCGTCPTCHRGDGNHCPKRTALGIRGRNGTFADYFTLPRANLHLVPKGVSDQAAVFTEPLAAALEILEQHPIQSGDSVAVVGDGRLGILIAQVLALTGCQLTVIGRHPEKWHLLKKKAIPVTLAHQLPAAFSARVVVECSGRVEGFVQARKWVQPRGYLIVKSTYTQQPPVDLTALVVDEVTLVGSRCGPFSKALALLEQGLIEVEPLIEREFSLDEGVLAFQMAQEKGRLKVLLRPRRF
ncbi:MAG: alcohol dehydrogenase catalytic domain-containing protein [Magnetococcales bacterium]|nr:alcohol dehydrogenase catalytic domain-containing protein [Magnetococcales bacterium]